jgi:hypothetical protein
MFANNTDTLGYCCGIRELGEFRADADMDCYDLEYYKKIKDIDPHGCGIFVTTYLPSQRQVVRELNRYHTLLFKTGPHKNTSHYSTLEGRNKGVILAVYKYGKDGK